MRRICDRQREFRNIDGRRSSRLAKTATCVASRKKAVDTIDLLFLCRPRNCEGRLSSDPEVAWTPSTFLVCSLLQQLQTRFYRRPSASGSADQVQMDEHARSQTPSLLASTWETESTNIQSCTLRGRRRLHGQCVYGMTQEESTRHPSWYYRVSVQASSRLLKVRCRQRTENCKIQVCATCQQPREYLEMHRATAED